MCVCVCGIVYLLLLRLPPLSVPSRQTGRRSGRRVFHGVSPPGWLPLCCVSGPSGLPAAATAARRTLEAFLTALTGGIAAEPRGTAMTCCDLLPGGDAHRETSGAAVRPS